MVSITKKSTKLFHFTQKRFPRFSPSILSTFVCFKRFIFDFCLIYSNWVIICSNGKALLSVKMVEILRRCIWGHARCQGSSEFLLLGLGLVGPAIFGLVFSIFSHSGKKNLFGSGQKVPGSMAGQPLITGGQKYVRVRSGPISKK